jgi:signal peptidase II
MLSSNGMQAVDSVEETPAPPAISPRTKRLLFWGTALGVIVFDQITKAIVRTGLDRGESWPDADWPLRLRYVTNTGAAFGILQDQTTFLIVTAVIGLAAIYLYYRYPPFDHAIGPVAIGLMLGGALGNLIDRIRVGRVTDFVDVGWFPAFNVADSSITIGIAILLIGYVFLWDGQEKKPPADS